MRRAIILISLTLGILCFARIACGQDRWYKASLITVGAAHVADCASSVGTYEANPILGRGPFGSRQVGIKVGVVGSGLAAQYIAVRKHPRHKRIATIVNFALAAATTG